MTSHIPPKKRVRQGFRLGTFFGEKQHKKLSKNFGSSFGAICPRLSLFFSVPVLGYMATDTFYAFSEDPVFRGKTVKFRNSKKINLEIL